MLSKKVRPLAHERPFLGAQNDCGNNVQSIFYGPASGNNCNNNSSVFFYELILQVGAHI